MEKIKIDVQVNTAVATQRIRELKREIDLLKMSMGDLKDANSMSKSLKIDESVSKSYLQAAASMKKTKKEIDSLAQSAQKMQGTSLIPHVDSQNNFNQSLGKMNSSLMTASNLFLVLFKNLNQYAIEGAKISLDKAIEMETYTQKIRQNLELTEVYKGNATQLKSDLSHLNNVAQIFAVGYGTSIENTMEMMQVLSRRFKTPEELIYYTNLTMIMHKLDFVEPKKAAENLEAAILSMGLDFKEARTFVDQFSIAVHSARITGTDLLDAIQRSGSAFKNMNMDTASTIAMISTLATTTAKAGRNVGVALNSLLANIDFKKAQTALKEYGVEVYRTMDDGTVKMREGVEIWRDIAKVYDGLANTNEEARNKFVQAISGGKFRYNDLQSLLGNWKEFEKIYKGIQKASSVQTAELLEQGLRTTRTEIERLKAACSALGISLATDALPALNQMIIGVREGVQWLHEHKDAVEKVIKVLGTCAEALALYAIKQGIARTALGKFIENIYLEIRTAPKFKDAMKGMGDASLGFAKKIGAAVIRMAAFYAIAKTIGDLMVAVDRKKSEDRFKKDIADSYEVSGTGRRLNDEDISILDAIQKRDALFNPYVGDGSYESMISQRRRIEQGDELNDFIANALQERKMKKTNAELDKKIQEQTAKAEAAIAAKTEPPNDNVIPPITSTEPSNPNGVNQSYEQESKIDYSNPVNAALRKAAAEFNIEEALVRAVASVESNFNPSAVSSAGAQGLMQLMPDTAASLGVSDPFDIEQNARGGAKYLREMLDTFGGDVTKAIAGYNAGPQAVKNNNGVPPYAETRKYVQKVSEELENERANVGGSNHFITEKYTVNKDNMGAQKLFTASELAAKKYEDALSAVNSKEKLYGKTMSGVVDSLELMMNRRQELNDEEWVYAELAKRNQKELDDEISKNQMIVSVLREQGLEWKNLTKEEQRNIVEKSKLGDAEQGKIKNLQTLTNEYSKKAQELRSSKIKMENAMMETVFAGVFDQERIYRRKLEELDFSEKMQKNELPEYSPAYHEQARQIEETTLTQKKLIQEERLKQLEQERAELQKGLPDYIQHVSDMLSASEKQEKQILEESNRAIEERTKKGKEIIELQQQLATAQTDADRSMINSAISNKKEEETSAIRKSEQAEKAYANAVNQTILYQQLQAAAAQGDTAAMNELSDAIRKTKNDLGDTNIQLEKTKDKFRSVREKGADVFDDLIVKGTSFRDIWNRLWNELASDAIKALFRQCCQPNLYGVNTYILLCCSYKEECG